ncbi:helix-turn-helix domain-containing protein [Actinomadura roseirufa]|uniref:helix-turn-helix domain-containing protein n=1 Tax=Actinomadura roseirufa TaxID=2094049 RepID=UPI0010419894|nr:helix-turn-helix transcriptional regulator [Actinomadura roseirufa]
MTSTPQPRRCFAHTRRTVGHTQESLALLLGVERSTVARWESGETEPQPYIRPKLADALKLSLEELAVLLAGPLTKPQPKPKPLSPLNVRVGVRLQAEREARGWGKYETARRLFQAAGISTGKLQSLVRQIRQWETGKHYPRDWAGAYAKLFEMEESELFGSMDVHAPAVGESEEAVKRRKLLESLATLGAATAAEGKALAFIRDAFNASLASHGYEYTAEDWQELAYEYTHSFLVTPRHVLMPELAADILALQEALNQDANINQLAELYHSGAILAAILAMTANSLGLPRESRNWWRSARHYAAVSGNRDLGVWVQGYESVDILYQGRPFRLVLDRAESAIRLSQGHVSPGLLEAMACKAQVLAQIGAADEAATALRQTRRTFEALPGALTEDRASLLTWPEHRLLHTESFVHSAIGPTKHAEQAHVAALNAYAPERVAARAQISLHRATTLVRAGNIGDGITLAEQSLTVLPTAHHTHYVRVIAGKVLEAVPKNEVNRPAVGQYRERLALPSPSEG